MGEGNDQHTSLINLVIKIRKKKKLGRLYPMGIVKTSVWTRNSE